MTAVSVSVTLRSALTAPMSQSQADGNFSALAAAVNSLGALVQGLQNTNASILGYTMQGAINEAPIVTLASAATVALGAAAANTVIVSGTTTITAFDTAASGVIRRVIFAASLVLTYNATSMILPTSANITTQAKDCAAFVSLGGGNWECIGYMRADGSALGGSFAGGTLSSALNEAPTASLASASTVNIGAAAANTINISGTTTINAFDVIANGAKRTLIFAGILTLTYNATSMVLPTGANITTAVGDVAEFESLGAGNWKCIGYLRQSGQALVGSGAGLTTQNSFTNVQAVTPYRANISGAVSIDLAATAKSNNLHLTLTGNVTSFALTNPVDGAVYNVRLIQDATGGRTFSGLPSAFKIIGTGTPAYPSAANAWGFFSAEYGSMEATYATSCPAVAV